MCLFYADEHGYGSCNECGYDGDISKDDVNIFLTACQKCLDKLEELKKLQGKYLIIR